MKYTSTNVAIKNKNECTVSSTVIGDRLCDDNANNAVCLFDRGDCCQVDKSTFCHHCTCIMDLDQEVLQKELEAQKLRGLLKPNDFFDIIKADDIKVGNVINTNVCAKLCMERRDTSSVSGWHYSYETKTCQCAVLISTLCINPEIILVDPEMVYGDLHKVEASAFVMTAQTMSCGNT